MEGTLEMPKKTKAELEIDLKKEKLIKKNLYLWGELNSVLDEKQAKIFYKFFRNYEKLNQLCTQELLYLFAKVQKKKAQKKPNN